MIKISLVVCLYKERDLLERLLTQCDGCYDDLIVVHDGVEYQNLNGESGECGKSFKASAIIPSVRYSPDWQTPESLSLKKPEAPSVELALDYAEMAPNAPIPTGYRLVEGDPVSGSIHELVAQHGGSFYEGPRCFQQEPHWPFAWWVAKHEWIFRLDADEFPNEDLKEWIISFRKGPETNLPAGYLCIWTQWDGEKELPSGSDASRLFFFNKKRVNFFGMVEHTPMLEGEVIPLNLLLHHRPMRPSYGLKNLLFRKQNAIWKKVIASSLMGTPLQLPRWRYSSEQWSPHWSYIREHPIQKIFSSLTIGPIRDIVHGIKKGRKIRVNDVMATVLHQSLMALAYYRTRCSKGKTP